MRTGLWEARANLESSQVVGMITANSRRHRGKIFVPIYLGLAFRQGDVCDLSSFADSSVDMVVSFETVEHLREPQVFFEGGFNEALKPGGTFICSVPNLWVDKTGNKF